MDKKFAIISSADNNIIRKDTSIQTLEEILGDDGTEVCRSDDLIPGFINPQGDICEKTITPIIEKAEILNNIFADDSYTEIFDISGGDLSNTLIPYLDFDIIAGSKARLWGYSDVTALINAIYTKTGKISSLYQVMHIILENKEDFMDFVDGFDDSFAQPDVEFLSGDCMRGILVGGNIRCFLKLAGTEYFPNLDGKILALESFHAKSDQVMSMFTQLGLMGAFTKCSGILLGEFTKLKSEFKESEGDSNAVKPFLLELIKKFNPDIPVAYTEAIGHNINIKPVQIGREYEIKDNSARFL